MVNLPNGYPRITPSSPVRDLGPGCMDYERCAALHNELLTRAVKARGLEMPPNPRTWWEVFSPSEDIVEILCDGLIEFYKRAYDTEVLGDGYLFYFLGGMIPPKGLMEGAAHSFDTPRFLEIYQHSWFRGLDDEGLFFDQETGQASWIEDWNDTMAVCTHEWGWLPLEVILDAYLQMHDEGKAEALPPSRLKDLRSTYPGPVDPWIPIHQYTEIDINRAVTAFQRLINAIDSRLENKNECTSSYIDLPWHDPVTLAQDFIPGNSFAHRFLQAVYQWKVRFRYIAPGIRLPTVSEFLDQPIKVFGDSRYRHLATFPSDGPLQIFQINAEHTVQDSVYNIDLPAGVYIDRVMPESWFFWSNGCRVLLPFRIRAKGWARHSNGQPFVINNFNEDVRPHDRNGAIYQARFTNGITTNHFVQINKVLNNWADRVKMGDWDVTEDGVAGGIEKFKEADTEEHWKKYWIPPAW
ncbi:hypothetical protein BJX99DRAFT_251800 [Aspergillus californicus]